MPTEFIPIAEETGLIVPMGAWILGEACRQLKQWQKRYSVTPRLTMNVNLSVIQLSDAHLHQRVSNAIEEAGIAPADLKLELTESSSISEFEGARDVLSGLQALGVGLKLDDFGTGYSSLSCLRALHFDSLKIDYSFVSKMASDPDSRAIVDTVIKLAHSLDMSVVAEGVEDEQQAEQLALLGCETGQGYLFSRPVEPSAIEVLLELAFGSPRPPTSIPG
jgi:EAL domain-containing protein (putative c-di-GMP-specific phosphodiesterase class I)